MEKVTMLHKIVDLRFNTPIKRFISNNTQYQFSLQLTPYVINL